MPNPTSEVLEPIVGFGAGVNIAAAQDQLKDDECLGLANMVLDENGGASKRLGLTSISDPGAQIISHYVFYRGTTAPQVLVHLADGRLRYSNDNGQTWTTAVSGMSTANPMSWETFNNKVYMVNGVDAYQSWSGTVATAFASAPVGKYLRVWKDTMWVAGSGDDRVYSSDPGNAEVFTVGNWVDLGKGDGDQVIGLATDGNVLIVPKRRRGFLIYDPTTFANRIFDPDKGAESHYSFIHFDQNLYYLSRLGVCVFLGDTPSPVISGNIEPLFQPDVLNFEAMNLAWGYVHNNRIGWSVPEAGRTVPNLQIELLPRSEKHPFSFHRMPVRAFATLRTADLEILLGAKTTGNALVWCFFGGDDDGAPFYGVVETRWYDLQNPLLYKYLRRMLLNGRGIFNASVQVNFESAIKKSLPITIQSLESVWNAAGDVWNDEDWGGSVVLESVKVHPDIYGHHFKFRFSDASDQLGSLVVDIGDVDVPLLRGQWGIYGGTMHGVVMGIDLRR